MVSGRLRKQTRRKLRQRFRWTDNMATNGHAPVHSPNKKYQMPTVSAINLSPVKSLGLLSTDRASITSRGIEGDRRFVLLDSAGRVITQRQLGRLTLVTAEFSESDNSLKMRFPDGRFIEGQPEPIEATATVLWGRVVQGNLVGGDWAAALSEFCGVELHLFESSNPGTCFDEYPVSIISQASIDYLTGLTGGSKSFESERFRPTILLDGCKPHEEDSWLGKGVRIGERLRLRLVARDPRCAITTLDPSTGERDFDTLRLILSYRPSVRAAYFGVYGIVELPGTVAVGDEISITM